MKFFVEIVSLIFLLVIQYIAANDYSDFLDALWEHENKTLRRRVHNKYLREKQLTVNIVHKLSELPIGAQLKSEAWRKFNKTRGGIKSFIDKDWEIYEPIIPDMPPELFRSLNFKDVTISRRINNMKLKPIQFAMYSENFSEGDVLSLLQSDDFSQVGSLVCVFSDNVFTILRTESVLLLLHKFFFRGLHSCPLDTVRSLLHSLEKHYMLGPARVWTPELTYKLGVLVAALQDKEIKSLRPESVAAITPDVMELFPPNKLRELRMSQVQALPYPSLLTWRRKTRILEHLYDSANRVYCLRLSILTALFIIIK